MKISTKEELFDIICTAVEQENLGLFVGAGFSKALLKDNYEYQAYSWRELLEQSAASLEVDLPANDWNSAYPEIASKICKKYSEQNKKEYSFSVNALKEKIADLTAVYPAEDTREAYSEYLSALNCSWIVTTNYDTLIESVLGGQALTLSPGDSFYKIKNVTPVYHIHGCRNDYENIVITNEDYAKLFRPNDYRQARLPFLIKESTMLMIGYALGDINVLTACDWARNVYVTKTSQKSEIIQLLYKENNPSPNPYLNEDGIVVYEIDDLMAFFFQLNEHRKKHHKTYKKLQESFSSVIEIFNTATTEEIEAFINDHERRKKTIILGNVSSNSLGHISNGYHKFLKNVFAFLDKQCGEYGNFEAYNKKLKVILDALQYMSMKTMSTVIFTTLASALVGIARYIGNESGQSFSANRTWQQRINSLPQTVVDELRAYCNNANSSEHRRLLILLDQYETAIDNTDANSNSGEVEYDKNR